MNVFSNYLLKQTQTSYIDIPPDDELLCIVVIPCYDENDLSACLTSLDRAACNFEKKVEVIVVLNDAVYDPKEVILRNTAMMQWLKTQSFSIPVHPIYLQAIPSKKAGVGFARKTGMDLACQRFNSINQERGIIFSMDADTVVEPEYFKAVYSTFQEHNKSCQVIYYEHNIDSIADPIHRMAIIRYELHLRYYVQALRFSGFDQAYQTLGSAFAVKALAYAQAGGMKPSKAGEDFYFIQKFAMIQDVYEVRNTTVHPSARVSHRVPFGTGRAILDALNSKVEYGQTYPWHAFTDLNQFLSQLPKVYEYRDLNKIILPISISQYFEAVQFNNILQEVLMNTNSYLGFRKRFFQKMNAFAMMKYVHFFVKDLKMGMEEIKSASGKLLEGLRISYPIHASEPVLLEIFRNLDKSCTLSEKTLN